MDFSGPQQAQAVRAALERRVDRWTAADGSLTVPAVPAMAGRFARHCATIFAALGREFSDDERDRLEELLRAQLDIAYGSSQRSSVTVYYRCDSGTGVDYRVGVNTVTIEEAYNQWLATREPPLFGTRPDARVMALAAEAADPRAHRVLDVGAGTGRNGLALARRGHPVDAVEMTARFADGMREEADREGLDVVVIGTDIFGAEAHLRGDYSLIVASEVVTEFRATGDLRRLFELADRTLVPGGRLVVNMFLAEASYAPDDAARQSAQQAYSMFFTRAELAAATDGLALELLDEVRAADYEQQHLPAGAWPPTRWYPNWSNGFDIFGLPAGQSPVDLRWLVYRKS